MKSNKNIELILITVLTMILLLLLNNIMINIFIGFSFSFYIFYNLLNNAPKELAYFDVIFFICVIQMIVLPIVNQYDIKDINRYLLITIPGTLCFIIGANIFNRKRIVINQNYFFDIFTIKHNRNLAKLLIFLGIIGSVIPSLSHNVFTDLISNFTGIGKGMAFGLMYYDKKKYWIYPFIFFLIILMQGIITAVFASVIAFGLLCFIYIPSVFSLSKKKLILVMFGGVMFISLFQGVKLTYRKMVWNDNSRTFSIEKFFEALVTPVDEEGSTAMQRASGGNTIALVYDYVPEKFPHLYGEYLVSDLSNALIPRILYPSKKPISNNASFMRYTGSRVDESTSVGINVFGISYAEFGIIGAWIFLLFYGFCLNRINNFLISLSFKKSKWRLFVLVIPAIFLSIFKFEQEFVGQIVGLLKTIIVFLIIFKFLEIQKWGFNIK